MNDANATYYSNRAAAYLELGWFDTFLHCLQYNFISGIIWRSCVLTCSFLHSYQEAEEDCSKAIFLDKKVRESGARTFPMKLLLCCFF